MRRTASTVGVLAVLLSTLVPMPSAVAAAEDTSWLVFADDDGGVSAVHPDGGGRRVVTPRTTTPGPNGVPDVSRAPDLSPDGSKVALLQCSPTTGHPLVECEVWTVGFDGQDRHQVPIAADDRGQIVRVSWSPDGTRLALGWLHQGGGQVVTIVGADGTGERDVAFGDSPDWSPDGRHLAYAGAGGLHVLDLVDGSTRLLVPGGRAPSWSPDGQRIAFTFELGAAPYTEARLAVVHPDGGGFRILSDGVWPSTPVWSPDSRTIGWLVPTTERVVTELFDLAGNVLRRLEVMATGWANPSAVVPCGGRTWLAGRDGAVFAFGSATAYGSLAGTRLNAPVVGIAGAPTGDGYWLLGEDGGVFTFGPGARFFGSTGDRRLNAPVLSISPTTTGAGYWMVAGDGGIFTFGDAPFYGSTGDRRLNQPVVALATTPSGKGYWLVAKDGGIFTFGDAAFFGSTGSLQLQSPIVAMIPTATGEGYWLVAGDGGVFTFGDAAFPGSAVVHPARSPVVATVGSAPGNGFSMATSDGQVIALGDAPFCGSRFGSVRTASEAIVGIAA